MDLGDACSSYIQLMGLNEHSRGNSCWKITNNKGSTWAAISGVNGRFWRALKCEHLEPNGQKISSNVKEINGNFGIMNNHLFWPNGHIENLKISTPILMHSMHVSLGAWTQYACIFTSIESSCMNLSNSPSNSAAPKKTHMNLINFKQIQLN